MVTNVDEVGIRECLGQISAAIEQLNAAAAAIDTTMADLPNYWAGAAYETARDTYDTEYKNLLTTTVPQAVEEFGAYIKQCMEKVIELDQQLAGN